MIYRTDRAFALLFTLASVGVLSSCAGQAAGDAETEAVAAAGSETVAAESTATECVNYAIYDGLAKYVTDIQAVHMTKPVNDSYATDAQNAANVAAWEPKAKTDIAALVAASQPVVLTGEIGEYTYDAAAGAITVQDFGAFAVPGVVVGTPGEFPYPAMTCQVGPIFSCPQHTAQDAWRNQVLRNEIVLAPGSGAVIPVSQGGADQAGLASGNPVEFEATFALAEPLAADPLLAVVELRSIRILSGGQEIGSWSGETTVAGRTTLQRMMSFQPQKTSTTCS
jgi:hypothetical protein